MTWRVAKSLLELLEETNARFPHRSKASDGTIGDAAHASRESDHNPWVKDGETGVVTALDITEDDAPGVPEIADLIVRILVQRRDHRVKYLIHEGKIWRSYSKPGIPAWTPATYSGTNGHFKHVHISVLPQKVLYDDTSRWGVYPPLWWHRPVRLTRPMMQGADVEAMARRLETVGFDCGTPLNVCGKRMTAAIDGFKRTHGLHADGLGDPAMACALDVAHH